MSTQDVATRFVDLALNKQWKEVTKLSDDEVKILFDIVSAAGFEPGSVVFGELKGYYCDTGGTFIINTACPFKVMGQNGKDLYSATGWLNGLINRVSLLYRGATREDIIELISKLIEKAVPFLPIQLTPEGDKLLEYPREGSLSGNEYFVSHTKDTEKLGSCVGIHAHCHGWFDRRGATEKYDALVCRACCLRVLFPREVETYGQLREAMKTKIEK